MKNNKNRAKEKVELIKKNYFEKTINFFFLKKMKHKVCIKNEQQVFFTVFKVKFNVSQALEFHNHAGKTNFEI